MPRHVRNFWIETTVDGAKKSRGTGPAKADGGFDLTIKQRDRKGITEACEIMGRVGKDNKLVLTVRQLGTLHPVTFTVITARD